MARLLCSLDFHMTSTAQPQISLVMVVETLGAQFKFGNIAATVQANLYVAAFPFLARMAIENDGPFCVEEL